MDILQDMKVPYFIDGHSDGEEEEEERNMYEHPTTINIDVAKNIIYDVDICTTQHIDDILEELTVSNSNDDDDNEVVSPNLAGMKSTILFKNFGQDIVMSHIDFICSQSNTFNSNFVMNVYVQANVIINEHCVSLCDEHCTNKDTYALCLLRLQYNIKNVQWCVKEGQSLPKVLISIRENYVGQNESNVTLLFNAWLSMTLHDHFLIIFLIPGWSHILGVL